MSKMIQIRDVPDELHRRLKARAALLGLSLSQLLLNETQRIVERPTPEEMRARLAQRQPVSPRVPPARMVRTFRGKP
jgi:plasmid stability protein